MGIRAIIWDLGGVLLRTIDYSSRDALADRMGLKRRDLEQIVFSTDSGMKAQRGEITSEQHWVNLRAELGLSSEEMKSFLDEFFAGDQIDDQLVEYIRGLRPRFRTGLLSNAFSNLREWLTKDMQIDDAFDEIIISSEVGIAKPDAPIYKLALDRLEVSPHEAVFVDDFLRNVEGARAVGMNAIHFHQPEQVILELEQMLEGKA